MSSAISDLCEISDLLFFVSYLASERKRIKFGDYIFDVRNLNFLVKSQTLTAGYSTGISITTANYWT